MPESLLVVSHDFGELANARQWTEGGELDCRVLLPARLQQLNAGVFAEATSYASAEDLLRALDEHAPRWLLLFTGYLLASQPTVGVPGLRRLLEEAARRGVRVATTDPFLGLIPRRIDDLFSSRLPNAGPMRTHFHEVGRLLEAQDHLFLAPTAGRIDRSAEAFFHPAYHAAVRNDAADALPAADPAATAQHAAASWPLWLFVLSGEDGQQQVSRWGEATFCRMLVDRIRDGHRCQRRTVFLGPTGLVRRVQSMLEAAPAATADGTHAHAGRDFCGLDEFRALQSVAEHAFYWNPLSNSIVSRLVRGQSIFFLDEGHMARAMPALASVAMNHYFQGLTPRVMRLDETWSLDALEAAHHQQRQQLAPARDAVLGLPTPAIVQRRLREKAALSGPASLPASDQVPE